MNEQLGLHLVEGVASIGSHSSSGEEQHAALEAVDWNFPERISHSSIEGMHLYIAKFVMEQPRALLSALPLPEGTAVLNSFCGGGATLVESQRRGYSSIGIDLNPIAGLMSRVKTTRCRDDDLVSISIRALADSQRQEKK